MDYRMTMRWCPHCVELNPFLKPFFNPGLGCLLTIITGFLFLPIWLAIRVVYALRPWRCGGCGRPYVAPWLRKNPFEEMYRDFEVEVSLPGPPWKAGADERSLTTPATRARKKRVIRTKVAGVSQANGDGTDRQTLIRKYCRKDMTLTAVREPENPFDENAISLWVNASGVLVQVGYIPQDLAEDLAPHVDAGALLSVTIKKLTGGMGNYYIGVNIAVEVTDLSVAVAKPPVKRARVQKTTKDAQADFEVVKEPFDWAGFLEKVRIGAVLTWSRLVATYKALPEWATPIVWGLGIAAPIVTLMAVGFWIIRNR